MNNRSLLNLKEFAGQLDYSVSAVRLLIKRGEVAIVRLSPRGRIYVPEEEVRRLLTPRRVR